MDLINKMLEFAIAARDKAYAPYSNFHVGACIKTKKGNYYSGCNVENASYGLTQCAEGTAICNMVLHDEQHIAEILVIGNTEQMLTPCGACRQKILEFADASTLVHMCTSSGVQESVSIYQLLPASFNLNSLTTV